MKRSMIAAIAMAAVAVTIPALAGEGHCRGTTQECLDKMAESLRHKGFIGVDGEWNEASGGYRIEEVFEGSPAEEVGLRAGDVLVAVNGIALTDKEASYADEQNRKPGRRVELTILRGGERRVVAATLVALTDEQIARIVGEHLLSEHTKLAHTRH